MAGRQRAQKKGTDDSSGRLRRWGSYFNEYWREVTDRELGWVSTASSPRSSRGLLASGIGHTERQGSQHRRPMAPTIIFKIDGLGSCRMMRNKMARSQRHDEQGSRSRVVSAFLSIHLNYPSDWDPSDAA